MYVERKERFFIHCSRPCGWNLACVCGVVCGAKREEALSFFEVLILFSSYRHEKGWIG